MKKLITVMVASLFLTACQSTAPKTTVNVLDREQQINRTIESLKSDIASSDSQQKRYDLALIYAASFDQSKRKLARPILQQLVEEEYKDSVVLLAQFDFIGQFGLVSDKLFEQYGKEIEEKKPSLIESFEKEKSEMETTLALHFSSIKQLYDNNYLLCEQPLDQGKDTLEKNSNTYLVVKYFNRCLEKYSTKSAKKRLQVMAKFQELNCSAHPSDKVCFSEGYNALSLGLNSVEPSFIIAAALRDIYRSHKDSLRKSSGVGKRYSSSKTTQVILNAFDAYNDKDLDRSYQMLVDYLAENPKLSAYDIAYLQKTITNFLLSRDKDGDTKLAIEYANKALASNELYYKEHWELFDLLSEVYLSNDEYVKYINMVGNYIVENQGEMELLPTKNSASVQ